MPERLTDQQIIDGLRHLPGWRREDDTLLRVLDADDFPAAIRIVSAVAETAESMDHHPDIDIRWRTLTFRLTTHSEGGLTDKDVQLAGRINAIVSAQPPA